MSQYEEAKEQGQSDGIEDYKNNKSTVKWDKYLWKNIKGKYTKIYCKGYERGYHNGWYLAENGAIK